MKIWMMLYLLFVFNIEVRCVQGLHLWRNSSSEINDELFKGYHKGNSERKINEIVAGGSSCFCWLMYCM